MSRLSQGQPLTYDYLTEIDNAIEDLYKKVAALRSRIGTEERLQDVSVLIDTAVGGQNATKPSDIQILAGKLPITYTGAPKPVVFNTINFDRAFRTAPVVVATVADPGSVGSGGANVSFATVTIGGITETRFNYKVEFIKSSGKIPKGDLALNYIAVGRAQ